MVSKSVIDLYHIQAGTSGPTLILLHGMTGYRNNFYKVIEPLARIGQVYALDLRGHGLSPRAEQYSVPDFARDVIHFINKLPANQTIIIGHSLGGLVTAYIASHSDLELAGIILEDPPLFVGQMPALKDTTWYQFFVKIYARLQEHHQNHRTPEDLYTVLVNEAGLDEEQNHIHLRLNAEQYHLLDPETVQAPIKGFLFNGFDPKTDLPNIQCAVHLLAGNEDNGSALSRADVDTIVRLIPNCTHVIFEGAGHNIKAMLTVQYLDEVIGFVNRVVTNK